MAPDTGLEGLLLALAKLQCDEPLAEVMKSCDPICALCAAAVMRAAEMGALADGISDPEIVAALLEYRGAVCRRRVLAHLRKCGVIQKDFPIYRLMTPGSAPTMRSVIRYAADRNGRPLSDVIGESRRAESVMARFEAAWIAVRAFGFPVTALAEAMGKNHTTLLSGINKIDIMIRRSPVRLDGLLEAANQIDKESAERFSGQERAPQGPDLSSQLA